MHVLFLQPGYQKRVEHTSLISVVPPLELASCAALVRHRLRGTQVTIIDGNVLGLSVSALVEQAIALNPDVVVLHAATHTIKAAGRVAALLQERAPIVLLGSHGTALPSETLAEFPGFSLIVRGEPEETLVEWLGVWQDPHQWEQVKGLSFGRGDGTVATPNRQLLESLDSLPTPARDLLPNDLYSSPYARRVTALRTTRGCPGQCTFCDSHLIYGCGTRTRTPAAVVDEFGECDSRWGTDYVAIIDHTFTADKSFVAAVCEELIERGLHRRMRWVCNTRVDMLEDGLVALMRKAGCLQVGLGIEAGDDRRLQELRKGVTESQLETAIAALKRHGIIAMGYAIIGFPSDTEETIARTRERLFHFDPHVLQLSFATPLPGSGLWRQANREKRLLSTDWDDYVFLKKSILRSDHLSTERLQELRDGILRDFYLRPKKLASLTSYFTLRARVSPVAAAAAATKVMSNLLRPQSR
jgi:anaerobic magnesium-protoporphyrin IX monomethyl ester cyclase